MTTISTTLDLKFLQRIFLVEDLRELWCTKILGLQLEAQEALFSLSFKNVS